MRCRGRFLQVYSSYSTWLRRERERGVDGLSKPVPVFGCYSRCSAAEPAWGFDQPDQLNLWADRTAASGLRCRRGLRPSDRCSDCSKQHGLRGQSVDRVVFMSAGVVGSYEQPSNGSFSAVSKSNLQITTRWNRDRVGKLLDDYRSGRPCAPP